MATFLSIRWNNNDVVDCAQLYLTLERHEALEAQSGQQGKCRFSHSAVTPPRRPRTWTQTRPDHS